MKKSILNIGLARSKGSNLNSAFLIELIEQLLPSGLLNYKLCNSETEKTLVAEVVTSEVPDALLEALSVVLSQDCIAALDDGKTGRLVGPKAESWAPFKASQFHLLNGQTLE